MPQTDSTSIQSHKLANMSMLLSWSMVAWCMLIVPMASRWLASKQSPPIEKAAQNRFQIDINQATQAELMNLPELGLATTQNIVRYRQDHGPITQLEQLLRVPGIGVNTLRELAPLLVVQPGLMMPGSESLQSATGTPAMATGEFAGPGNLAQSELYPSRQTE